ncbi:MAG TPA: tetratricopeptide repeat protein [Candidatus Sulfotelmatobacter sp.]|nr:tetratricopeptide repeat protein [Candidatus Sulfotelmatobacter sp.]
MIRLYSSHVRFDDLSRRRLTIASAFLLSLTLMAQEPAQPTSLHGVVRDADGKAVAEASVLMRKKDSTDGFLVHTNAQGGYSFTQLPEGVYSLRATKEGYAAADVSAVFLRPRESKIIDLTLVVLATKGSATSAPQFFDQPQFTVAGVTDTTTLGGHGSDTIARTRNSLAKDTVSLAETAARPSPDAAREASLRELVKRQPHDFGVNHQLGQLLIASGRAQEAIPFLERATATDPANYENAYDLALANSEAGNYAIARDKATKLLVGHDQADLHHLLGDVDEKLGDSLEAVRQYQRAAELDPSESHLFDWGAELLLHHAPEPAMEVFSRGNRLFPRSARMMLGLGATSFARGAHEEAIQRICGASDLSPNDSVPYQFLGKIEEAETRANPDLVEKLHRYVTLHPDSADANYYYALGLWKLRNPAHDKGGGTEVESLLKTAIKINPQHAAAALQLGIVHSEQGAYNEAISDYRKALDADPGMEEAHYRLAQAYRQIGNAERAKEELRLYGQLAKESAQKQDRERHEIKQFVYTLRDQPAPQAQ